MALLSLLVMGAPAIASDQNGKLRGFKGWELYSWQSGRQWKFSVLVGTNRTKSCSEVKDIKVANTLGQLKKTLLKLESGQEIFWVIRNVGNMSDRCDLALPPAPIVKRVKDDCRKLGLHLTVM